MKHNNFCETDKLLHQRVKYLSNSSKTTYDIVFDEIYDLTGKTPTEMVKIGLKEQDPYAEENGEKTFKYLPFRTITNIHEEYDEYLSHKYVSNNSKKTYLLIFRALFNKYRIELPDMPKLNIKKPRTRTRDLPLDDDLALALELSSSPFEQLLFLTPRVTGFRLSDIAEFTYGLVLEATKLYHNGTLEDLLSKNPYEIIPRFEKDPVKTKNKGNLCITFATPEWTYYFFKYTHWRLRKYEQTLKRLKHLESIPGTSEKNKERLRKRVNKLKITPESPVFISNTTHNTDTVNKNSLGRVFWAMNEKINKEKKLQGEEYNYKDKNNNFGKFRCHNLRKVFSTVCRNNIFKVNVVTYNDKFRGLDVVSLFTGHIPPNMSNSEVYDAVEEDSFDSDLRQIYTALVPYHTINREKYDLEEEKQKRIKAEKESKELQENIENTIEEKMKANFSEMLAEMGYTEKETSNPNP